MNINEGYALRWPNRNIMVDTVSLTAKDSWSKAINEFGLEKRCNAEARKELRRKGLHICRIRLVDIDDIISNEVKRIRS